jgi:hypothetical protein
MERGATPVGNEKRRPAQQARTQIAKQEAVGRDPADGLRQDRDSGHEVPCRGQRAPRNQIRNHPLAVNPYSIDSNVDLRFPPEFVTVTTVTPNR